jgi:hypothetical protein
LHFVPDSDDPWEIVRRLVSALPNGSYLALSHATPESFTHPSSKDLLDTVYAGTASGGVTPRPKAEIERFFSGLEIAEPGAVNITAWRPEPGDPETRTLFYGGVARKGADADRGGNEESLARYRIAPRAGHPRSGPRSKRRFAGADDSGRLCLRESTGP